MPPEAKPGKELEPYLRFAATTKGSSSYVAGYVNSESLRFNSKLAVEVLAGKSAAVLRASGTAVAFPLSDLDACREAMRLLLAH